MDDGTKLNYVNFYDAFAKFQRLQWERSKYTAMAPLPFVPTEAEIDLLIHGIKGRLSIILQILKETAMRIYEVSRLKWKDIETEHNIITLNTPEKHSKSRMFKISQQLIQRILKLPQKHDYLIGKSRNAWSSHSA